MDQLITISVYLDAAIATALIAAFIILLITKTGAREWVQVHGSRLISQMFNCDFCLSFWTGFVVSGGAALITGNPFILLMPILSTPLTRVLI